ncbi:uncharacterized protein LOC112271840 [Brachypodium distachyon]|uniref:PGG domain-containing protein n=1 Tax=Brachypodium distachyon TaxID=15368 RepID=A0A0Q3J3X4_BRADI|nr:uncharacterized protein LOC112271840 [Brachypodium distachyon]KQJ93056.1 hypothetical protein BRADI_3g02483v3 [Brachypodium distachyon]|eukprot:XP_024317799.1 uncharacterized protein LOC112271840 [Brachypodium distachyon]
MERQAVVPRPAAGGFPWTLLAALAFLAFNSAMAVYRSNGDQATIVFVATSYVDLVLLSCCLWLHDRAAMGSAWRDRLKASVWTLTTLLTFSFGYIVMGTAGLTLPVALLVWIIAAATGIGAFSAFFDRRGTCRVNEPLDETMLPPV